MSSAVYSLFFLIFYIWYVMSLLLSFHKSDPEKLLQEQRKQAEEVLKKLTEEIRKNK